MKVLLNRGQRLAKSSSPRPASGRPGTFSGAPRTFRRAPALKLPHPLSSYTLRERLLQSDRGRSAWRGPRERRKTPEGDRSRVRHAPLVGSRALRCFGLSVYPRG